MLYIHPMIYHTQGPHTKADLQGNDLKNRYYFIVFSFILILFLAACPYVGLCQESESKDNKELNNEKVLVQIGDVMIEATDLKEYLAYRPASSSVSISDEIMRQRLDEMITSEALYQEGIRLKIHEEPAVRRMIHQIVIQKLMEDEVEKDIWNREIEEEKIQAYYNKQQYQWNRPQQVRLADIYIAVDPADSAEQSEEKKKKADSVLAEALEKGRGRYKFSQLIKEHSDKHPKYSRGDTTYFDAEGNPVGIDRELAKEAFTLKRIGEIGDHVIETAEGYHIIMLVEKRPAVKKSLEEVKSMIERQIRKDELEEAREAYIKKIKENTDIKKNDQGISDVFKAIKEQYTKKTQSARDKFPLKYRNMNTPPPFPGEEY